MADDPMTQLLLLLAGAVAGLISGLIGSAYKNYLDRKSEVRKTELAVRHQYLYPLLFSAEELRSKLALAYDIVSKEKDLGIPESDMTDRYYLRHWFWKCKEYIINQDTNWSDDQRKRELAMHSGGVGYGAASTLYITAYYLWHATRIRLRVPSELEDRGVDLVNRLEKVRRSFSENLEFYDVTQDSTGATMTNRAGEVMNYREFCEAMTVQEERAWFLTLADVYFKLHRQRQENVVEIIISLEELIHFLRSMLKISASGVASQLQQNKP